MPKTDDNSPATKGDITILMESIGKLYDANAGWKDEILEANEKWKDEIIRHFDVVAENMKVDYQGIFKDRTEQHTEDIAGLKKRVSVCENASGIVA